MPKRKKDLDKIPKQDKKKNKKKKRARKVIPKGTGTFKEGTPLDEKDKSFLDNLSDKKLLHPMKRKKMSLSEAIQYEGESLRASLATLPYFLTKAEEDEYVKQVMSHAKKLHELITEPVSVDFSLVVTLPETGEQYPAGRLVHKGVKAQTIFNINKSLKNLLYEVPRSSSIARGKQKAKGLSRWTLYGNIMELFKQHGLKIRRHEVDDSRSDFYQCVFIALKHAGDRNANIRNIDRDYQENKKKTPTQ